MSSAFLFLFGCSLAFGVPEASQVSWNGKHSRSVVCKREDNTNVAACPGLSLFFSSAAPWLSAFQKPHKSPAMRNTAGVWSASTRTTLMSQHVLGFPSLLFRLLLGFRRCFQSLLAWENHFLHFMYKLPTQIRLQTREGVFAGLLIRIKAKKADFSRFATSGS